jgi:N-acetylglucosamine malate deacetylase 1
MRHLIESFNNILVLAPHTDDGELGCGGAISRFVEAGKNVYYAAFSTAEQSVPEGFPPDILKTEVKAATSKLGIPEENLFIFEYEVRKLNFVRQEILEHLVKIRNEIQFDLVLMPSLNDIHQDHYTVAVEGLRAFKNTTILGYELIWNNLSFDTDCFITLKKHHVGNKVTALQEYSSQAGKKYVSHDFITSLATVRGVQIGTEFAECFEVIRLVL